MLNFKTRKTGISDHLEGQNALIVAALLFE